MQSRPQRAIAALLLATTSVVALGGAAYAQSEIALGEILVQGQGGSALGTSSGSKLGVAPARVPQSVSVLNRAQLDTVPGGNTGKIDEALRYSSGVNTQTYGTDSDTEWYFIRGFQADQTGVLLDELPLYQSSFGTFLVDPYLLESVEVLKGPASVLYGGANVGGIVNMTSKRPTGERLRRTEAGINNFGNAYAGFDLGDGNAEQTLSYRLTGKVSGGGWQTQRAEDLRGVVAGSVKASPSAATDVTLYGSYQAVDLQHTSTAFLPYEGTVIDRAGVGRIPRDFNFGEPGREVYNRNQATLGYELKHDIDDTWTVRQNARYAHVSLSEDFPYPYAWSTTQPTALDRVRFLHDTSVDSFNIDTRIEGKLATGPVNHEVFAGVDFKNYQIDQIQRSGFPVAAIDVLNPVYGQPYPGAPSTYLNSVTTLRQTGIYAQDQMQYGGLIATLNGRYDWIWTELNDRQPGGTVASASHGAFSGRAGLAYEFDNGITPYVSYATSFNPQLTPNGTGGVFAPETGRQWEVGVKYEPTAFDGLITASFFNLTRANVVDQVPGTFPAVYEAIGEVNVKGAELEGKVNVGDFSVISALTYLEAQVVNGTGSVPIGNSPTQIPRLTASLWVDYTIPDGMLSGLSIGGGVRVQGESWADAQNTRAVPAAAVFDAGLTYKGDDWGASLKVSNIFDNAYVASCKTLTNCGYGAGRTATLSVYKSW